MRTLNWAVIIDNISILLLQLKTYKVKSTKKSYIKVNTKKLNRVPKYNLSILYILGLWFMLH